MNTFDKLAIEKLAHAETYHGPERGDAEAAYMRGLKNGEARQSIHMLFASEVFHVCPDLMLRGKYRGQLIEGKS